ncbi:Ornithine decarboxylase [Oopsacas minuta]|uniref:ornithine decarboxylase n=1 Tax=Oopsacas minuta TaxID=111878 RepID=A0AAV7JCD9_9METZ|nr:Ornithine decarboxylase [Oopsacas minuta]
MTNFLYEGNSIYSILERSPPREILSHLLTTRHAPNDDPFFAINLGILPQLVKLWKQLFPSIRPFYAVKCNPDTLMLSVLARLGVGFDCASKGEIRTVLGVLSSSNLSSTDSIIYANPCKQLSHIQYAKSRGVNLATFDNTCELYKHSKYHPDSCLVLRIQVDDSSALCKLSNKFGCPLSSIPELLQLASQLGLRVVGVSFHVGSGCMDAEVFRTAIRDARKVFDSGLNYGYRFTLLDIGGGFPSCPGLDPSPSLTFLQSISNVINTSIATHFSDWAGIQVIAEPGRFFAGSSHILSVSVTSSRECTPDDNNNNTNIMYYVNEGVYGAFNCIMFDHQQPQPQLMDSKTAVSPVLRSSLWGPSCDGLDQILKEIQLPVLSVGDWLFFEQMGAYTRASRSDFNGFSAPINYYYVTTDQLTELYSLLATSHPYVPFLIKEPDRKEADLKCYPIKPAEIGLLVSAVI